MSDENINRDPDMMYNGKTIYTVSKFEIFWRNFIAGFGRGLGNFLFTILIFVIITGMLAQFLKPFMNPIYNAMNSISAILNTMSQAQQQVSQ